MGLPLAERDNPRDIALGAATAGRFHDVVLSLSKVLHGIDLESEDRDALQWAKKMLSSAGSRRAIASMPSAKELSNHTNPILILRRAAQPTAGDDLDQALLKLSKNLDAALRGRLDEDVFKSLASARTIFSMVSQISLGTNVAKKTEQDPIQPWLDLTTTSD